MSTPTAKTPGVRFLKVFICHGCQSCWRMDENMNMIDSETPHYLSIDDVTPEMVALGATLELTPKNG